MKLLHACGRRLLMLAVLLIAANIAARASSHREAPLISNDPLADNTDVYAFRSPDNPSTITIIANYIPFELPEGGPNYYTFGENIRYEIHIKNNPATIGDDITYRFTFTHVNEDTTTFFNIRLGKQNIKTTYICEKSTDGGKTFVTIISNGVVPPNNIGPRSIDSAVGLNTTYDALRASSIFTTVAQEKVFCGPADDPFFADLGGIFDVGNFRPQGNSVNPPKDALARFNVHSIALQVPISLLQKNGENVSQAVNILDPNFIIGVWASASRQTIKTFNTDSGTIDPSGNWVQVSRLGMPLTNEAIIPVGMKDLWNTKASNSSAEGGFIPYFENPELALYMDTTEFGNDVPALSALRIQTKSLGTYDFRNGKEGLWPLKGNSALIGTALDPATYGNILLPDNHSPRAVDLLPIFYTGVPNLSPYQLATGKPAGSPLSPGKPFINNFLPTLGDMLRLNMAVPPTDRTSPDFSSLGIIQAAVLGLTDSRFDATTAIQDIPNMDGFPNGRRLEDDVITIELQAVSGVALAAIGLWYDDYTIGGNPVTPDFTNVYTFTSGVTHNDTTFKTSFPYVQTPWRGFDHSIQPRF